MTSLFDRTVGGLRFTWSNTYKVLRIISVALGCCSFAAAPVASSAQSTPDEAIRTAYKVMEEALLTKDAAKLSALLSASFYQVLTDGTVETREAFIKDETSGDFGITHSSIKYEVTKLTASDAKAEAQTTHTYVGTYSVNGIPKPFSGEQHLTDEWAIGSDGIWRLRVSTMHDAIAYIDGKLALNERQAVPPTSAAIAEMQAHAIVIPTLAINADPNQLWGIGSAIGGARIVGMGEGSHGTTEFFAFKNRLFKFLVEKKGFTVFALEAYWGAGLYVDRYIKTGRGTAQQAVASLAFWTWDTPEMVNLVQWMHDYNVKRGKHPILSFVGIDMQSPMGAIGYLMNYLRLRDPGEAATAHGALECVAESASRYGATSSAGCQKEVLAVSKHLDTLKNAPDIGVAQHAVATILQYLDWKDVPEDRRLGRRDRYMAENLEWLAASHPHAKIAVWAHNFHIGTSAKEFDSRPMGGYLRSAFGQDYYAIGQTFGAGSVRAIVSGHGLQNVTVPPSPGDTIAALFGRLNAPAAFIDLRGLRVGTALWNFFSTERSVEAIGAMIDPMHPAYDVSMVLPNAYDGLVYVPISTGATSGSHYSKMHRGFRSADGTEWDTSGVGFDEVTSTASAGNATITNADGLNSSPNQLTRQFDAAPYAGETVEVTGEILSDGLLGFVYPIAKTIGASNSVIRSTQGDPITDTGVRRWQAFEVRLQVAESAQFIDAGFWAEGLGSAEVRNLKVTRATSLPTSPASPQTRPRPRGRIALAGADAQRLRASQLRSPAPIAKRLAAWLAVSSQSRSLESGCLTRRSLDCGGCAACSY